jgi:hypothetical protein
MRPCQYRERFWRRCGCVIPASGKRAPTGLCFSISNRLAFGYFSTYVSSVAMVAVGMGCRFVVRQVDVRCVLASLSGVGLGRAPRRNVGPF